MLNLPGAPVVVRLALRQLTLTQWYAVYCRSIGFTSITRAATMFACRCKMLHPDIHGHARAISHPSYYWISMVLPYMVIGTSAGPSIGLVKDRHRGELSVTLIVVAASHYEAKDNSIEASQVQSHANTPP